MCKSLHTYEYFIRVSADSTCVVHVQMHQRALLPQPSCFKHSSLIGLLHTERMWSMTWRHTLANVYMRVCVYIYMYICIYIISSLAQCVSFYAGVGISASVVWSEYDTNVAVYVRISYPRIKVIVNRVVVILCVR